MGLLYEAHLPGASIGSLCHVSASGSTGVEAEVIGFKDKRVLLMPFEQVNGVNVLNVGSRRGHVQLHDGAIGLCQEDGIEHADVVELAVVRQGKHTIDADALFVDLLREKILLRMIWVLQNRQGLHKRAVVVSKIKNVRRYD